MSLKAMQAVWDHLPSQFGPSTRLVALAIADSVGDHGVCWPKMETLAHKSGLSVRTVQRITKTLIESGIICKYTQQGGLPTTPDFYRPNMYEWLLWEATGRLSTGVTNEAETLHRGDTSDTPRGDTHVTRGVTPMSPLYKEEPKVEPKGNPNTPYSPPRGTGHTATASDDEATDKAFQQFWDMYPRKEGRLAAKKAFIKALKEVDANTLITAAERYRNDPGRVPRYTAHASTWLNQGRWDDEPLPTAVEDSTTERVKGWLSYADRTPTVMSDRLIGGGGT